MATGSRQSGVALLIVLVVLFIVAVLMADVSLTASTARRSASNDASFFLLDAAIEGQLQVATAQLAYDLQENKFDSPDDRWTTFKDFKRREITEEPGLDAPTAAGAASTGDGVADEDPPLRLDSGDVEILYFVEDEERKFNLNLLKQSADRLKQQEEARKRFAFLLYRFRLGTPLEISRTRAEELKDAVCKYLDRPPSAEGERTVPIPKAKPWPLLTPDELRNVEGFEDREHGLSAEGILLPAPDPQAERLYLEDPENVEKPPRYPGLLRYVTLWSGSAWIGAAAPDTWARINVNTAEKPVLETLFHAHPEDVDWVDKILEYRSAEKEDAPGASADLDAKPKHQYFTVLDDLKKIEGFEPVMTRNGIGAANCTVQSGTFSVRITAKRAIDGAEPGEEEEAGKPEDPDRRKWVRTIRYVVRRHDKGFQTLLREERTDPDPDETEGAPGEVPAER